MAGIRDLLGKYGITQHAEGAKKRKSKKAEALRRKAGAPAGETFEQQLKREGVITKKKMTVLEQIKARRDYTNRMMSK